MRTIIHLVVIALAAALTYGLTSCAGAADAMHYVSKPGRITVYVLPSAERIHPGLTASVELNRERWCHARGLCWIDVRDGSPQPTDWLVMGGGVGHNATALARTIFEQKRITFFLSQTDGDRIRLVPPGACRKVLPPHQTDAEIDVIVGHELGHAMGLPVHSNNPDDIMHEAPGKCRDVRP